MSLSIVNLDPDNDPRYGVWHLLTPDGVIMDIEWDRHNAQAEKADLECPENAEHTHNLIEYRRFLQPLYEARQPQNKQRSHVHCEVGEHRSEPYNMYCIDFDIYCCRDCYEGLIERFNLHRPQTDQTKVETVSTADTDLDILD